MMPRQPNYYDPIIQTGLPDLPVEAPPAQKPEQIGGIVNDGKLYLLLEDVVAVLRYMSYEPSAPNAAVALWDAAEVIAQCGVAVEHAEPEVIASHPADNPIQVAEPVEVKGIARVEVFPDAEGKWYARTVDATGTILETADGSFDREYVILAATQRWPGVEVREVSDASVDSIWQEQQPTLQGGGFNGRRRPSPKRMWT